jgi:hypothetical protein
MTQSSTFAERPEAANALHHCGILINLIVTLLAPMFLGATGGDIGMARMAAEETVRAYCARDHADLIAVAQIIAFGLAALGSLSLSMADDISLSMTLRLRSNANALSRSSEQVRRSLSQHYPREQHPREHRPGEQRPGEHRPGEQHPGEHRPGEQRPGEHRPGEQRPGEHRPGEHLPDDRPCDIDPWDISPDLIGAATAAALDEDAAQAKAVLFMSIAAAQELAAEADARLREPEQTTDPVPHQEAPPTTRAITTEKQHQNMWAIAMVNEAAEITAAIPNLPPEQREAASLRAGMLGSIANQLITGVAASPPLTRGDEHQPDAT